MDTGLKDRIALVSGGSRGIGLAIATALAQEGVRVALLGRDAGRLATAVSQLKAQVAEAVVTTHVADVRDGAAVRIAVDGALRAHGGLHILVNAAATPADEIAVSPVEDFDENVLRHELETKALGYLRTIAAVTPAFKAQGWGRIINIGGLSVRQTGSIVGSIRNAAVSALTANVADELGPSGITANVIHPGFTATERTPALLERLAAQAGVDAAEAARRVAQRTSNRRYNTAQDIAGVAVFLASEQGIALNGEVLYATGGVAGHISGY